MNTMQIWFTTILRLWQRQNAAPVKHVLQPWKKLNDCNVIKLLNCVVMWSNTTYVSSCCKRTPSYANVSSLLYFLCLASLCPMLQTRSFSWFCMTSVCCLHSFVIRLYTCRRLKAVCKCGIGVHLRKFPMVRRILFCRYCNFKRQVSAANSQAGQAGHWSNQ
jgi:hypothetical protein